MLQRGWIGGLLAFSILAGTAWSALGGRASSASEPKAGPVTMQPASPAEEAALARAVDVSLAFQAIARNVTPAVVSIQAVTEQRVRGFSGDEAFDELLRRHFGGGGGGVQRGASTGSGVIVSADGYILTNNHVVENATRVRVQLDDGREVDAKIVGTDPDTDVAVLKIEGNGFSFAKLGDSDDTNIGETVIAIGSPFGLSQTVTSGIISAKGRRISGTARGNVSTQFEDFLQTDAAINPGNSGGPLVNLRGEVIGINTAIFSRTGGSVGIGFAIPANMARSVMESLISTGKVQRGWLGVSYQPLNDQLARMAQFAGSAGVYVSNVVPGSPAEAAGLKPDDIIVEVNGRPVRDANAFRARIATMPPDRDVALVVFREGKKTNLTARLGNAAQALAATDDTTPADNPLGVAVRTVNDQIREEMGDRRAEGVVIVSVKPGSPADQLGLQPGDVIFRLNRAVLRDVAGFKEVVDQADLSRGVTLGIRRNGMDQTFTIRVGR